MNKQAPSIAKAKKTAWEAVGRFFWGYMNTDRFTKFAVPDATVVGFSDSNRQHEFVGTCEDRQQAEKSGRDRHRRKLLKSLCSNPGYKTVAPAVETAVAARAGRLSKWRASS